MKTFLILLSIFVLFFAQFKTKNSILKPQIEIDAQASALNFEPVFIKLTSFGNSRLVSAFLWSATLLFSDETHLTKKDKFSWMYYRFKNISDLEPYFYKNYLWGGQYLSVIKDDRAGALLHLERSVTLFPIDMKLNYYLGYHQLFEMKNYEEALKHFKIAYLNGHTYRSLPGLIAKLEYKTDEIQKESYKLSYEAYLKEKDEIFKKKYYQNAYALKANYDLSCLNNKKFELCDRFDLDGKKYDYVEKLWTAKKKIKLELKLKR